MKREKVKVFRGTDKRNNKYVLLDVGASRISLDPDKAEELAHALQTAARDVRSLRGRKRADLN